MNLRKGIKEKDVYQMGKYEMLEISGRLKGNVKEYLKESGTKDSKGGILNIFHFCKRCPVNIQSHKASRRSKIRQEFILPRERIMVS